MLVHCRIYLALSISMLDGCIKEIARFPPLSLYSLLCLQMHRGLLKKKKKTHERCNCYAASLSALLSCGALLAVHDGLKFAVRVSGGFLRSSVFLGIA